MSKEQATTDPNALVTATITRDSSGAPDANANYSGATTTVASGISGDLQPLKGDALRAMTGIDTQATEVFYPVSRVSGSPVVGDYLTVGSVVFRIKEIRDWGGTYPQEFYLERLTEP